MSQDIPDPRAAGARGSRARLALSMGVVGSLVLGGCASIPTSGPVHVAEPPTSSTTESAEPEFAAPAPGASPEQIVTDFLAAGQGAAEDYAAARRYLAPELAGKLAQEAADEGWSVREVERRAQAFAAGKVPSNRPAATPKVQQADIASLETELSEALGAKVAINHGRGGKGKLIIQYTDLDTLDGVLERLRPKG